MKFYLRYCCAMCFALISFLLATSQRAQAQTREAYVAQSADKTTLTFYYDDQRATRAGTTWGIEETQEEEDDTFPAWADSAGIDITRVVFDASFRDFRPTTTARWFSDCRTIKQIEGLQFLNTSEVKDMRGMFSGCSGLTSLDLSHFNTQNVTGMGGMFSGCSGLTSLDLSHFNTQNVTDMGGMFEGCSDLTSLDVSRFNTQKVESMLGMFAGCSALTTIHSNTAWQCPESDDMFAGCEQLKGAVAYDENKTDITMANPETGYFTRSRVEAYVAQSEDATTLTFYYDGFRAFRTGKSWGIEETKKEGDATFPAWAGTYQVADSTTTRVVFDASFRDFRPATTARWFCNYGTLKQVEGLEFLNTSEVKDMGGMFYGCSVLPSLDLKYFTPQNVTDMSRMFYGCSGLLSLELHFNTQNVTDMSHMFYGCSGLLTLGLHFSTQNVTDMGGMFSGCSGLTSLSVSHFNTQNVTDMGGMFSGCSGLTSLDVSHFNTQNVTKMNGMFFGCGTLTTISSNTAWRCPESNDMFTGCTQLKGAVAYDESKTDVTMANSETGYFTRSNDAGVEAYVAQSEDKTTHTFYYDDQRATRIGMTWGVEDTKKEGFDGTATRVVFDASFRNFRPTTTARWFSKYGALKQIEGMENLNTQNVTKMRDMFFGCSGLTSLDLSHFNTQNVTDMFGMFRHCSGLTSLDLSHFNTQNVTNMNNMFNYCSGLTSLDVSHFNTQNVTDMTYMFSHCSGLTSLDLSDFNTQNVTNMSYIFSGCSGLTSLDLSHFNTQNVTNMEAMFKGCSGLTSLDLSHFNTQNVTYMGWMFYGCSGLTSLDLQHFNTQNVTYMEMMFWGCSGLTSLDLQHFKIQKVTYMYEMFYGCSALTTINSNTAWQCPRTLHMFDGCTQLKGAVPYDENKTDGTMANPETGYFTAKPTTVESVRFGTDGAQQIYTLQGKRVREAWKHLPAGVYVVNGKKTVKL